MWKRIVRWWEAQGDLVRLRGLDDRLLSDMGLKRSTLQARVMGADTAEPPARERACPASELCREAV